MPDRALAPTTVWLVTAGWLVLLLAYSVLLPTFRAPDEPSHVGLVLYVSDELSYPRWDRLGPDDGVTRVAVLTGLSGTRHPLVEPAPLRADRPSFEELRDPPTGSTRRNQLAQHPPLYYALAGGYDRLVDDVVPGRPLGSYDVEVWALRLFGAATVAPLPIIIWRVARRLGLSDPLGVAATLVPFAIPQLAHIGASVNNDTLFLLLAWCATPPVLALAQGDLRPRKALTAGALVGLALFTKGMGLVLPLWLALAVGVGWWRRRDRATAVEAGRALALAGAATLALGGWWWIRNVVVFGKLAPSIEYERRATVPGFDPDLGVFAEAWYYKNARTFWGTFGWGEAIIPVWLFGAASVVALVAVALALRPRVRGVAGGLRLVLVAPLPLLIAFTAYNAWQFYDRAAVIPLLQGRYWYGSLAGAGVLAVLGPGSLFPRARYAPLVVLALAGLMHAFAIHEILVSYWGAPDAALEDRVEALVAWAPVSGRLLVTGGLVGAIALASLAARLVTDTRTDTETTPTTTPTTTTTTKLRG